jgi:hypothetical protein
MRNIVNVLTLCASSLDDGAELRPLYDYQRGCITITVTLPILSRELCVNVTTALFMSRLCRWFVNIHELDVFKKAVSGQWQMHLSHVYAGCFW